MMPCWHFSMSPPAACSSLRMMFSTSSPTYPASVSVVASTIVKGTESSLASVCASSVLPVCKRFVQLHAEHELLRQRQLHVQGERRLARLQCRHGDDHGEPGERCAGSGSRCLQHRR